MSSTSTSNRSSTATTTSSNLGGFPPERFVAGSFNDNLLCSICRYVFDSPVLTPCGHLFCASCLTQWLTACQTLLPSCPECRRTVFAFDVRPVRGLRNYIASLPTYCSHRRSGCDVVMPLDDIKSHETTCSQKSSPSISSRGSTETSPRRPTAVRKTQPATTPQRQVRTATSSVPTTTRSRTQTSSGTTLSVINSIAASSRPLVATVTDHRPNARQRLTSTQRQQQQSQSLLDRVNQLEMKLEQVRLDIEVCENRNIWLETQLTLARNNLSLADALRRARGSNNNNNNNNQQTSQSTPSLNRRRSAAQVLGSNDE